MLVSLDFLPEGIIVWASCLTLYQRFHSYCHYSSLGCDVKNLFGPGIHNVKIITSCTLNITNTITIFFNVKERIQGTG